MDQDMLNENLNNRSWKNKLEDAEDLSMIILQDKNAAWEKLHSRLHQPPRRIKAIWYWAAAACLLIAMLVPMLTANKKQPEIMTNNLKQAVINKTEVQQQIVLTENKLNTALPENTGKTITVQTDHPLNNKKIKPFVIPVKPNIDLIVSEQKNISAEQNIVLLPVQIPVTAITTSVAVTERKKLKVVHINELGDPVLEPHTRMLPDDYGVIQFKLIDQQVYTTSPASSFSTSSNILKSKNVPSN
jgi:hypothetical protein